MKEGAMKILVTAPTGKIGRRIVLELLAPEFSVRVLVRDPGRLAKDIREQVEVVVGSMDDTATLRRALEGVEALFWCVPTESLQETNVEHHYERFACAAWRAIREAQTPRVVTISTAGEGQTGPLSGLHAMEEILNESGAAIRHLRCGFFMENILAQLQSICERGVLAYPLAGDVPIPMTTATEIADAALRLLVRRNWAGIKGVTVPGAAFLTFIQAASVLERIVEWPVRYQEVSASQYIQTLVEGGASAEYATGRVEMLIGLARGVTATGPGRAGFTTLANWAEEELVPAFESFRLCSESA